MELNHNIPNAAIAMLMPFCFTLHNSDTPCRDRNKDEREESVLQVAPAICNPNSSYETTHLMLQGRSQLPYYKWSAKQHQVTGYGVMINLSDGLTAGVRSSNDKNPVCDLMNTERLYGTFSSLNLDDLSYLQRVVMTASLQALDKELKGDILEAAEVRRGQRESNAKSIASIKKYEPTISIISILNMIAQVLDKSRLRYFADAIFQEVDRQNTTSSTVDKILYPWQLCSPEGPLKSNDFLRTLILFQKLTKIRLHIKHFPDHCHHVAQVLEAMGCLQNAGCAISEDHEVYPVNMRYLQRQSAIWQKLLDTTYMNVHEKGADKLITDDKLLQATSLSDIIANITPKIYNNEYMRYITNCANGLTNDIHIPVRSQVPFPGGELGNMAEKVLTKDALHACIGIQYLVGHQMLQMMLYYLYDVIQDGSIFPSLQGLVSSYEEERNKDNSICTESGKVITHIFNMSKMYSTPSADSALGRLLEAFSVNSGSNQFQQWSSDYCSQDPSSNKSYIFDANEQLLASDIPLPENNFLRGNFIWCESTFKTVISKLRSSKASQWERRNTAQLVFLARFCFTSIHKHNSISILEKISANNAFNDYLFTTVMNICYTAWLDTTLKWCEKQTNSTFGQIWNKYRFRRQLNPREDAEYQLPDIQCQDLKFGFHLIVGMKMVLLLPLWLTNLVDDDDCKKKCAQIYNTCHITLSRSTKNVPYKSFVTNWNFSQSEFDSFDDIECNCYSHLSFMVHILCAFYSCLMTLKTDDWRECRSEERECTSAYPKHPDCTTFSSLLCAFYKFIKIIMASPFDERRISGEDEDQHSKNPLKFLILHFCDITLPLINDLKDGENATMLMGRLNLRKISFPVSDLNICTTDDKEKKKAPEKKKGEKCGGKEKAPEKKKGEKRGRKKCPGSTFTIDGILEMIKDHFKCGYDNATSLPKIDGQEVVPLADVRNAIMLCINNSTNADGSISIVASKVPKDHDTGHQGEKDGVLGEKETRKMRKNCIQDQKSSKKQNTDIHLHERKGGILRAPALNDEKPVEKMRQKEIISDEESYGIIGKSTQHHEKGGDMKGDRASREEYVKTLRPSKRPRLLERFVTPKGKGTGHDKLSDSTNRLGLGISEAFADVDPDDFDI